jgi:hypothetical protein
MAGFLKRSGRWQARITRKGHPDLTKTFAFKDNAQRWARAIEREIDARSFLPRQCPVGLTLSDLIKRYVSEGVPHFRGPAQRPFDSRPLIVTWAATCRPA